MSTGPVDPTTTAAWSSLTEHRSGSTPDLRGWFAADPARARSLTFDVADLHVDLSKNLVTSDTLALLLQLAAPSGEVYGARETVETLRGTELLVPVADLPAIEDLDSFYDHQLVGLAARLPDGTGLGEVTAVRHEAQDLLVLRRTDAPEALIPFVSAIVPSVDLAEGFLVVDPPEGLLEL